MSEIQYSNPSLDGFSPRDIEAMRAAGSIADLLGEQLSGSDPHSAAREFLTSTPAGELLVTVELPEDPSPCTLGEIWNPLLPPHYFTEYTQLDVLPVAIVSTSPASDSTHDNYYVYHVYGSPPVESAPELDTPGQEHWGVVVAGHVKTYHELLPTEEVFGDNATEGGDIGRYTEVVYIKPTSEYYVADQHGVNELARTVQHALREGIELPPMERSYD